MIELLCPCCKGEITIQVSASNSTVSHNTVGDSVPLTKQVCLTHRFPPTWRVYGGELFTEVMKVDPSYMERIANNESIKGELKDNLTEYINSI